MLHMRMATSVYAVSTQSQLPAGAALAGRLEKRRVQHDMNYTHTHGIPIQRAATRCPMVGRYAPLGFQKSL